MREPGFYYVKQSKEDSWTIGEYTIISGTMNWPKQKYWELLGIDLHYKDSDFAEIDERRIVREREDIPLKDQKLTVSYLLDLHPELTYELACDLLKYSRTQTITLKGCYGDGSIIYPEWKKRLPK